MTYKLRITDHPRACQLQQYFT